MTATRGMTLLALAGSLLVTTTSASAGPSSALDPYAYVQAPRPAARKPVTPRPAQVRHESAAPRQASSAPKQASSVPSEPGVMSGVKEIGGGFVNTSKAATAGIANTYKKAGSGVVKGGKFVGHGFINGAKASGAFFAKGAKSFGHGVVVAGEKVKDGTAAAGSKVVSLPGALHGGDSPKQNNQANDLKEAPRPQTASAPQPQQATSQKSVPQADNSDGSSLGGKVVAVPKAIGHGFAVGAGKMKDGTEVVGKKMIAFPGAVWGKLLHRGGDQSQATAQAPNSGTTK